MKNKRKFWSIVGPGSLFFSVATAALLWYLAKKRREYIKESEIKQQYE